VTAAPSARRGRTIALAAALLVWAAAPGTAQIARPAAMSIDTVASLDTSFDENGRGTTGVVTDSVVAVDFGHKLQGIVRPFAQRLASGEWNRQVWVAAVRYERPGRVGLRVDGGLIPPPVGLGNLTLRPHLNPTVSQPTSLFQSLPAFEPQAPRTTLLGAIYPFGVSATASSTHWDARAAVIDVSPLRPRRVFTQPGAPPRFTNLVLGGGVTPLIGLRVGASVTHGGWRRDDEIVAGTVDRNATVVTIESEFAVRYTRVAGEWVRDRIGTQTGTVTASSWFVVAQQTLSPRWFAAARVERMTAPLFSRDAGLRNLHVEGVEPVVGFRVTPEVTLRAGYRARRVFGATNFDHQAVVSAVWWRRWL
jgi:hypothetical protein